MIIAENELVRLRELLKYLSNNRLFFRDIYNNFGDDDLCSWYKSLPVIDKTVILDNIEKYVDSRFIDDLRVYDHEDLYHYFTNTTDLNEKFERYVEKEKRKWVLETTSGSSGKPFAMLKNKSEKMVESNYLLKKRREFYKEVRLQDGFLLIEPTDEFIKKLNYRGITDANIGVLCDYLLKQKPTWILTTTLLLRKLSAYIRKNKREDELKSLNIRFIETTSQSLTPIEKNDIEKLFNTRVLNQYGCRETWNIAYECKYGNMHVNDRYLLVDLIDDKGKNIDEYGVEGKIIISSFVHKSMPLVKYYLGDRATFVQDSCPCGCNSRIIRFHDGRSFEKLLGSDYYGTVIFRKVLRYIYYDVPKVKLEKIKIFQCMNKLIKVFAEISEGKEIFEKEFRNCFSFHIPNYMDYDFEFIYNYRIEDMGEKEFIFINYLGNVAKLMKELKPI